MRMGTSFERDAINRARSKVKSIVVQGIIVACDSSGEGTVIAEEGFEREIMMARGKGEDP